MLHYIFIGLGSPHIASYTFSSSFSQVLKISTLLPLQASDSFLSRYLYARSAIGGRQGGNGQLRESSHMLNTFALNYTCDSDPHL